MMASKALTSWLARLALLGPRETLFASALVASNFSIHPAAVDTIRLQDVRSPAGTYVVGQVRIDSTTCKFNSHKYKSQSTKG